MSQFGLFLQNDTLFMTIPITSSVKTLGRKVMPGDVFELPHLKDEYALNDFNNHVYVWITDKITNISQVILIKIYFNMACVMALIKSNDSKVMSQYHQNLHK